MAVSLIMTVRSHSYHQSKFFNSSKWITGNIYNTAADISSYFELRDENNRLVQENEELRKLLFNSEEKSGLQLGTTAIDYEVISANLI